MDNLPFSSRGLDAADAIQRAATGGGSSEQVGDAGSGKEVDDGNKLVMPLVWIDLEMTGLNIEVDRILEIACIITDGHLIQSIEGPDLVIHQSKECIDKMNAWCQKHHYESGLVDRVRRSTISEREAEKQIIEFVKRHAGTSTKHLISGNSVYTDLIFLRKYMPELAALLSHVIVDVSSLTALCIRWYPKEWRRAPPKSNNHRAMDDIRESIAELKFFKENIFKPMRGN